MTASLISWNWPITFTSFTPGDTGAGSASRGEVEAPHFRRRRLRSSIRDSDVGTTSASRFAPGVMPWTFKKMSTCCSVSWYSAT